MSRIACFVLALLAFVALLVLQFNVPWGSSKADAGFGSSEHTARTWGEDQSRSAFGTFSSRDSKSWYDGGWDKDEQNAVNQLRIAAPLLAAGAILLLVGGILALGTAGGSGPIIALIGAVLTAGGAAMYYIAIDDLYDTGATWQVGFYVAVGGAILGLVGGVLGLIGGTARQTAG